ncbi:MAG: peptide-binding protein [Dehalococcoidia bacterium]|nr:MAG: peptide-binding protein [Dehalococcoidia bacterium]
MDEKNYWQPGPWQRWRSRPSRRQVIQASAVLAGWWLAACAQGGSQRPSEPVATRPGEGEPRQGGQAVIFINHPDTLNPAISPVSTTIYNTPFFYNGLTRPADDYQSLPDLAESWEISSDSLVYTFKLRRNVKFHDGQPFTAEDVKFTWELISHPENTPGRQIAGFFSQIKGAREYTAGRAPEIEGIKILDPYTIQVTLVEVYAPFLSISAGQPILPKHVWKDVPVRELGAHPASRRPVGTGPFILESWRTNDSMVLRANPEYYAGRPYLDRIISVMPGDATTAFNLLKAGELNVMGLYAAVPIDNYEEAAADPRLETRPLPGLANMYVEFNFRNPLFQDLRVRKAISYATDRKAIRENLWKGRAVFINGPIHPTFWAAKLDTTTYDNDPAQARQLLAEAGWRLGPDGILEKEGTKFRFKVSSIQTAANPYDVVLQEQWKRVGIDAQIERMDFASFWAPIYLAGRHEVAALNLPFGLYLDPDYPLGGYFSSALNRNKYVNPRVDELIRLATATLDREERKQRYYELQETLARDVPHLWLGVPDEIWGITRGLVIPKKPNGYLTIRTAKEWYWAR